MLSVVRDVSRVPAWDLDPFALSDERREESNGYERTLMTSVTFEPKKAPFRIGHCQLTRLVLYFSPIIFHEKFDNQIDAN